MYREIDDYEILYMIQENNDYYELILEKYKPGGGNRYTCPSCGRRKCFTRYIRTNDGEYIDESCGKCDHDSSCGYHYTPKEFFHDHPELANNNTANYHPANPLVNFP